MVRAVREPDGDTSAAPEPPLPAVPIAWPNAIDVLPTGRCRFTVAPPRHFLYPAILLLVAEKAGHGYALVEQLNELGLGRMDRPSVYRAIADLETDGLVLTWDEPSSAGSTRHVHSITAKGEVVLESWMTVIAQERSSLDLVLRRYWYSNAQRVPALDDEQGTSGQPSAAGGPASSPGSQASTVGDRRHDDSEPPQKAHFEILPSSSIVVEARSNVGPIAFSTSRLTGWVDAHLAGGLVQESPAPAAHIEVEVSSLSSGNGLYDAELLRRVDARRFPTAALDLQGLTQIGEGNCYQLNGEATIHGVTQRLIGMVTAAAIEPARSFGAGNRMRSGRSPAEGVGAGRAGQGASRLRLVVSGEHVLDIRSFGMATPMVPLFKIYPDVRLHLRLEADGG